ncbi:hypothetical protein PR202_ga02399 [Eleusine coracana subsp. coracana]|uniref:DNA topoisomerase 2 n=1 Tax=Eleusine coracana subsp. coracana TaxID=191504 RepID=A0AAV5BKN3_ELECO|nr:hypothetical protein PR202_ga02399 [Eleusine coracana subsp. coracana]
MAGPLQSSSVHNAAAGGKTIEEMYQKKSQLEHILLRPDTYIGSVEKHTQTLWVYEGGAMENRQVSYVPGLYKIFDEILVNAADNKQRDPKMDSLRVNIDVEGCCISVYNNGDGIPVEIHQEEGVYVPEMIFGHLLTSSNYDDNVRKTTGGRNGYGAKLTNIFSTEFVIETADGRRQKKYKQIFSENMGKKLEPQITKCKQGENWTRVTFKPDLSKFNMTHLEDDVVALMRKRVVDMAGTLGKTVKVELDGQRLPIKSFLEYVMLYLRDKPEGFPRIYEKINDRWEVCVSVSEGQFQQVSFVNRIATIRGGTHVDYVTNQIATHIMNIVNKKNKNANMKAHNVKSHLWVFVNALIDNPAFRLTDQGNLDTHVREALAQTISFPGLSFKLSKELKKTDGSKRTRITGLAKLEDANDAGGKDSHKCTLILTEGDSAKALAMAGISEVGRDRYGVFPSQGKTIKCEGSNPQADNGECRNPAYKANPWPAAWESSMIAQKDHDGSHIKGLLINFIHSFWPSLLKVPFLVEFITPIVKATKGSTVISFFTMPEYEAWKKTIEGHATGWSVKYYKGLGTSTNDEGKEYFKNIVKHRKDFIWKDEKDDNDIELAFSKKRIQDRKEWLTNFQPGTYLDNRESRIKYSDFINKELILFSMADLQRSIPSMVDGLKPGQRKILFCSFKRNLTRDTKVAQFSGYVSEHSAYHHGEQSLASTIIGMAQHFVGSNNINLLYPSGQFGTRNTGGKDAASGRYIFTRLSRVTRTIFPKDDDLLLNYLNEDGQKIEPTWYVPIIPMVLVNGSEGIGTGWSTYIPNYNPRDIIANLRRLLNDELTEPMHPWYRGFKGSIEMTNTKDTGVTYTITGIIEAINETKLRITELPIRRWTEDYKKFIESLLPEHEGFIETYKMQGDADDVYFDITLSEENMDKAKQEGLEKKFKLTTTIGTTNMHLFDSDGKIRKYDTPEQILEEFYKLRLAFYEKRKRVLLENLELEFRKLSNKARFIGLVVAGDIDVRGRKKAELCLELQEKGFDPFPKKQKGEPAAVGAIEDEEENEASPEAPIVVPGSEYDYLLSMSIGTLTLEKQKELEAEKERCANDVEELKQTPPKSLWFRDLEALEKELDVLDKYRCRGRGKRRINREKKAEDDAENGGRKKAPKRQPKKTVAKSEKVESATTNATVYRRVIEDYVPALKDRLAAFNINDSSADSSAMEIEMTEGQQNEGKGRKGPSKRGAAKKASSSFAVISSDDEEGDDLALKEEVLEMEKQKKGRGRKPAAAEKPKATATRKRATSSGQGPEAEKRRSSLLTTTSENSAEASPPSGSSIEPIAAPQPRRTARATKKATVVYESDESEDDVVEVSDDSDFDLDGNSDDEICIGSSQQSGRWTWTVNEIPTSPGALVIVRNSAHWDRADSGAGDSSGHEHPSHGAFSK